MFMEKDAEEPSVPKVHPVYFQLAVCLIQALPISSSDRDHCCLLKRDKSSDSTFLQHTLSSSTVCSFLGLDMKKMVIGTL